VAAATRILTVDLGSSTLKAAAFQLDGSGGLTLLRYGIRELGLDPNKEQDRFPFIVDALQNLMREKGMPTLPAYCSLSGQFVFSRFVKLPPVDPAEIDKMVVFEAQQNVPFPIHEVVWDYQMLGGQGAKENEALIVAIKKEIVEQAGAAFKAAKLPLQGIDVAGLALINAFYYNYGSSPDCRLLIDIGAKSTNLIFIEGARIFIRVIPVGGHLISQNISNEFQEPYVAAETLKRGKGFVGLGGAYKDPDDAAAARISKIARTVYSKLHAELNRSVGFYRNQQGGTAPKQIFLAGGASAMPFSDLFFKEKMNLPVEYFNPLRNVALAPEVDRETLSTQAYQLGELVGLALRKAGGCPVEINLESDSVKEARQKARQMPNLVAALVVWFIVFAAAAGINLLKASSIRAEAEQFRAEFDQKSALASQITRTEKDYAAMRQRIDAISRLVTQRDYWPELVTVLSNAVAANTGLWLSQVDLLYNSQPVDALGKPGQSAPGAPAGPAPRRPGGARPGAAAPAGAPADGSETAINLAPRGTELNLRGFVEVDRWEIVNNFTASLMASGWFESVDILEREPADQDQIATRFYLKAVLKPDKQPSLQP
jgi:type IV pilus assembly protein PilM